MKSLLFFLFCLPLFATAQNAPLLIQGTAPNLYLNHTVAPKENYYSIGRLYNISPKEIAPYNNLKLEAGLALGQTIMIPLTENNFSQTGIPAPDEAYIPVYYTVHDKEGFYRISVNNNKVPITLIKKWNNITSDGVSSGTPLIIGFLKVKKDVSLLASGTNLTPDQVKAAVKQPTEDAATTTDAQQLPVKNTAVSKPVKGNINTTTPEETPSTPAIVKPDENKAGVKGFDGGSFKTDYDKHPGRDQLAEEKGDAGIFKSNSGWQDGRYYCLYDNAQAGTIVKITDNTTGKVIYAKVLEPMPDMKQNTGILLRISNAAAAELGVTDVKFDCTVSYF